MGSGKKNKRGGAPKQKGKLQQVLKSSLAATEARKRALVAQQSAEARVKASATNAATGGGKKRRKIVEREKAARVAEKQRVVEEDDQDEEAEMVVEDAAGEAKVKVERERKRGTVPYKVGEKILLVGEGNFSFAHSLLLFNPPTVSPHLLLATSYDTLEVAQTKYPDLMEHVDAIKATGARVLFGVDATSLAKCREIKDGAGAGWDKVGFNFPHVGLGITDQDRNVRANQTLILKFLRSVVPFLAKGPSSLRPQFHLPKKVHGKRPPPNKKRPHRSGKHSDDDNDDEPAPADEAAGEDDDEDISLLPILTSATKPAGTILITLRTESPYSLWHVQSLATRGPLLAPSILPRPLPAGPQPTYRVVRSFEFDARDYEGYEHRRTVGFKEGVSSGKNEDLVLSARERGEKRKEVEVVEEGGKKAAGERRREEKETKDREKSGKEKKGAVRTWELEWVPEQDEDDAYD